MRVYISGPITGIPDGNIEAFNYAEKLLREAGHDPVNPNKLDCADGDTWEQCMRRDIATLMSCDALLYLPGSDKSKEADFEVKIALTVGIPAYSQTVFFKYVNESAKSLLVKSNK